VQFDALVLVSFGGPDGPDDVMPFLENVLRGRRVAPGRMEAVAARYLELGGVSPINGHNRALLDALRAAQPDLPVYWGNRNWRPFLTDTVARMAADGVQRAAAFVTSAYSSYSSCRQYLDDIEAARAAVGPGAPEIVKLRPFFNHPGFVDPFVEGLRAARQQVGPSAPVLMTAHSIPLSMAEQCDYGAQLRDVAATVSARAGEPPDRWQLVFQSRSGPPDQPWLGPDVSNAINDLPAGPAAVIVVPIGFVSDHMEVVWDLDREAAATATGRGIQMVRVSTPGVHPAFVAMVGDLLAEAEATLDAGAGRPAGAASLVVVGSLPAMPVPCRAGCCPAPGR
jgi:ferrochelatase